ncbi:MAG: hypothetical protein ACO2OR_02365 [Desulfurococcaceae archaeon]
MGAAATLSLNKCMDLLEAVKKCVKVLPGKRIKLSDPSCEGYLDAFRECTVRAYANRVVLDEATTSVKLLVEFLNTALSSVGGRGWLLSREMSSFVKSPVEHLKKKLTLYLYDLLRGKLSLEEYAVKARAAVTSSLNTNMRTLYEVWVLTSLLRGLGKLGGRVVYPEHGIVHFDRAGKQKAGILPPNFAVSIPSRGSLSFFLEAPRPIGWRDFKDLKAVWRLYTTLRPDIMVYPGLVENIVDLENPDLPIRRPQVIIECKEQSDWFLRVRELKGPLAPSFSFDEWFKRWLSGLWTGLADVLGISGDVIREVAEGKRRGVRVTEVQLVLFYKSVYKPDKFYLVSKPALPGNTKRFLENEGVIVVDSVQLGCEECIEEAVKGVLDYAKPVLEEEERLRLLIDRVLREARSRGVDLSSSELLDYLEEFVVENIDKVISYLTSRKWSHSATASETSA